MNIEGVVKCYVLTAELQIYTHPLPLGDVTSHWQV
jgi:hypothetical protein